MTYTHNFDRAASSSFGAKIPVVLPGGTPGYISNDDIFMIGKPGGMGFGVGVCPPENAPSSLSLLPSGHIIGHDNYGNYVHLRTGSVVVFVPRFYYRWGHLDNKTRAKYAPNDIDIVGTDTFATTAAAEAAGYRLHRAFIDGGVEQVGFFVDKYKYSKVAVGTGFAAASIKNGLPLSPAADHNPIADISACTSDAYFQTLNAAKGRDSANGEFDQECPWFEQSVFTADALAKISLAHGQAALSSATCAWFDPAGTINFPKGCNNNALKDANDGTVFYQSDGYSNCGRTGSGAPFAKTTHNGQECGVADLNGLMYEVLIGMTCVGITKTVTGVAKTNPVQVSLNNTDSLTTGQKVHIESLVGPTTLNGLLCTITVIDGTTISLDGVNGTALPDWVSGGTLYTGTFYLAKPSVRMADFTSGQTLATDHWGALGVAAMMDAIADPFPAPAGGIARGLKMGSGSARVFDQSDIGDAGVPLASGVSTAGATLFGQDYYETYYRDLLCVIGCMSWHIGSLAGVFARNLSSYRASSFLYVSGRSACYPV
jgi:hypothetical protein